MLKYEFWVTVQKKQNMIGQQAAYPYLQFYCKDVTSTGSSDYNGSKWGCKEK